MSREFPVEVETTSLKFESIPQKYIAEKEVIRLLLLYADEQFVTDTETESTISVADYLISEFEQDELEFHHPVYALIYAEIISLRKQNEKITEQYFIKHPDELISKTVIDLITSAYDLSKIWKRYENYYETEEMRLKEIVPEAMLALKNEKVLKLIRETEEDLRYAQEQNNEDRMQSLQVKFIVLNTLKISLSKELGDRIIVN